MLTLAMELSTDQGSLAILNGREAIAEQAWHEKNVRHQHLFKALPELLNRAGIRLEQVDLFAAGRGPGNYSGLRVAITTAQALALPGNKKVFAVSSGEALAVELLADRSPSALAIIGDARRDSLWYALFEKQDGGVVQQRPWSLARLEDLGRALPAGCLAASPHYERLQAGLPWSGLGHVEWIRENRYPTASRLGQQAVQKMELGLPSEELTPIYMHPAVDPKNTNSGR